MGDALRELDAVAPELVAREQALVEAARAAAAAKVALAAAVRDDEAVRAARTADGETAQRWLEVERRALASLRAAADAADGESAEKLRAGYGL